MSKHTLTSIGLCMALGFVLTVFIGCQEATMLETAEPMAKVETSHIQDVTVSATLSDKGEGAGYILAVTLDGSDENVAYPDNILILSPEGDATYSINDLGQGHDTESGDFVYTGVVPAVCVDVPEVQEGPGLGKDRVTRRKPKIKCSVELAYPGEQCGSIICSEKSALFGAETHFCICSITCTISV